MVVKNNYHYTERIEDCPIGFMANGDIAHLKRLRRFEEFYGFRFANAVLEFPDYDDTQIECKILLDTIASESPSLTREESSRLFYEVEKDYLDIKSKLKRFKEIRENPHFNAVQVKFSYAVTCHKAQGGQWSAVFIDRCLFGDEPMTRDMLRWLYTALTRATDRLYLVNFDKQFLNNRPALASFRKQPMPIKRSPNIRQPLSANHARRFYSAAISNPSFCFSTFAINSSIDSFAHWLQVAIFTPSPSAISIFRSA